MATEVNPGKAATAAADMQQVKAERNEPRKGGNAFLDTFRMLPEDRYRTTDSGLKIATLKEGEGQAAGKGNTVSVRYTGWLQDGTQFDSTQERGEPFEFKLGAGRVIKGMEEGLAGIKPGERRQIVVPAELAYGERQVGDIPPGSTLVFNVEAVGVQNPAAGNAQGGVSIHA